MSNTEVTSRKFLVPPKMEFLKSSWATINVDKRAALPRSEGILHPRCHRISASNAEGHRAINADDIHSVGCYWNGALGDSLRLCHTTKDFEQFRPTNSLVWSVYTAESVEGQVTSLAP